MIKPNRYPSVDESRDRLHRAGWTLGETCFGERWQVEFLGPPLSAEDVANATIATVHYI